MSKQVVLVITGCFLGVVMLKALVLGNPRLREVVAPVERSDVTITTEWTTFDRGQPTARKDLVTDTLSGHRRTMVKKKYFTREEQPVSFEERRYYDYAAKSVTLYFPVTGLKASRRLDVRERGIWHSESDCTSGEPGWDVELEPEPAAIQGYRVVKRTMTANPIRRPDLEASTTARVVERWVAPDLDCYDLRIWISSVSPEGKELRELAVETMAIEQRPDQNLLRQPEVPEVHITDLRKSAYDHFGKSFDFERAVGVAERFYERGKPDFLARPIPVPRCESCGDR